MPVPTARPALPSGGSGRGSVSDRGRARTQAGQSLRRSTAARPNARTLPVSPPARHTSPHSTRGASRTGT
ncbi:hypothetical protein GCM10023096_42910 [Nonomuraea ferruginea]